MKDNILPYFIIYFGILILIIFYNILTHSESIILKIIGYIDFVIVCICVAKLTVIAFNFKEKYEVVIHGA